MTVAIKAGSTERRKMKEIQESVINEESRKRNN